MQSTNGQSVIEHFTPFIQSYPQRVLIRPGLPDECLVGHGLMGALNRSVIGGPADTCKDHLDAPSASSHRCRRVGKGEEVVLSKNTVS